MYFNKGITFQRARNNYITLHVHSNEKRLKLVINFNNNYVYRAIFEKVIYGPTGKDGLQKAGACQQRSCPRNFSLEPSNQTQLEPFWAR